jgi:outer membrane protein
MSFGIASRLGALLCASFVLLALLGTSAEAHAQAAPGKFAVIDLRRAVADTEDGLRVQAELQQLFDSRQSEYEAKEKAYTAAKTDFEKLSKAKKTPDDDLRKRYAALEKMAFELQAAQTNYRREMQQKESQLMYPIVKQMLTLVRRLAGTNGYDMVLNKEAVPYYRADLDITDRIIQMYNASNGSKSGNDKTPAPKKQPAKPAAPKTP